MGSSPSASARRRFEALPLLVATAIGGGTGYVLMVVAGVQLTARDYSVFAVFWSALYLIVSALLGVQQEVARAVTPVEVHRDGVARPGRVLAVFSVGSSALTALVVLGVVSSLGNVLTIGSIGYALPLAVGAASYVAIAVVSGVASGLSRWTLAASVTIVDAVLRFGVVLAAFALGASSLLVAWTVVLPLPTTLVIVVLAIRERAGRFSLDVTSRKLSKNVARTVAGGAAMGALISGLPLLIDATSRASEAALLASLIFTLTVARAPLIIVVMALQSYLVVTFRRGVRARTLLIIGGSLGGISLVLGGAAALVGPPLLQLTFPESPELAGVTVGAIVASGGVVAMMCVTGALCLARSHHSAYVAGWVVAAILTVAALSLPLGLNERLLIALAASPLVGLAIHVFAGARRREDA